MSRFSLLFFALFMLIAGCEQKPDAHYVGNNYAPTVQQIRILFTNRFRHACTGEGTPMPDAELDAPWRDDEYTTSADECGVDSHRCLRRDADTNRILTKRDNLRAKIPSTEKQPRLSSELECLLHETWGCQNILSASNYGIHCNPVLE